MSAAHARPSAQAPIDTKRSQKVKKIQTILSTFRIFKKNTKKNQPPVGRGAPIFFNPNIIFVVT